MAPHRCLPAALLVTLATGCASTAATTPVGISTHYDVEPPPAAAAARPQADSGADPLGAIDEPFYGQRLSDGELLSDVGLLDVLARADVVCVGEHHDDALHHWAQLAVLHGLASRSRMDGRELALGLEMVPHAFQRQLDAFHEGTLPLAELPDAVEWTTRWGYDFALYRPLLELTARERLAVLGLNARREVTRAVARHGLRGVDAATRSELPHPLDLDDAQHRAAFDAAMAHHPATGKRSHLYAAQVVWDETMADTAARWLAANQPARQLVIAAGVEHCRAFAVPRRVARRVDDCQTLAVLPTTEREPDPATTRGYDLAMVIGSEPVR